MSAPSATARSLEQIEAELDAMLADDGLCLSPEALLTRQEKMAVLSNARGVDRLVALEMT